MAKTADNLKTAFAGESQANRRYLAFAKRAEEEELPGVARLFRAAAAAETVHALSHLKAAGGVKTTEENLQAAVAGELYEFTKMYPEFIDVAEAERNKKASVTFQNAKEVETIHHELYEQALNSVKAAKPFPLVEWYVCPVCGNTVRDEPPGTCPICGTSGKEFMKIE